MLREFLNWWAQQLLSLLPQRLTQKQRQWRNALIAEPVGDVSTPALNLTSWRGGRETLLGQFALDDAGTRAMRTALASQPRPPTVLLRLPPGLLLEQQIALPLAAERDPYQVLSYEMDRITPFSADDVFWTWQIERRDRAQGKLHLRLSLVPKMSVSTTIAALRQAGAPPSILEAASPGGVPRLLPLLRGATQNSRWRQRALVTASGACMALAVAAVIIPFVKQSVAASEVEERIEALRPQVDQADALRKRIASAETGGSVFAAQRERVGNTLGILAALTEILPDDTHLTDLTLRARVATLSGQSAAAARLIAALASDPVIRNPAFTAPVTRNEIAGGEGFTIRAEFAP